MRFTDLPPNTVGFRVLDIENKRGANFIDVGGKFRPYRDPRIHLSLPEGARNLGGYPY